MFDYTRFNGVTYWEVRRHGILIGSFGDRSTARAFARLCGGKVLCFSYA